jgi:hypothetical protein
MTIQNEKAKNRDIAHYIFTGSATMIGVCITVITLFKVTETHMKTIADEILGINAFIFIISCFLSYLSLRKDRGRRLELIADVIFFTGMFIMVFVGLMIVFLAC